MLIAQLINIHTRYSLNKTDSPFFKAFLAAVLAAFLAFSSLFPPFSVFVLCNDAVEPFLLRDDTEEDATEVRDAIGSNVFDCANADALRGSFMRVGCENITAVTGGSPCFFIFFGC